MSKTYIRGVGRANSGYGLLDETHLYEVINKGTKEETFLPLCSRGFNRDFGSCFSIFRGNVGNIGVCQVCESREQKQKPGISWKRSRKIKKSLTNLIKKRKYYPLLPGLPLVPDPKYFSESQWDKTDD